MTPRCPECHDSTVLFYGNVYNGNIQEWKSVECIRCPWKMKAHE